MRLRAFEAPMCRTRYVTGYTDEIAEFYEPRVEIRTYWAPEELIQKTRVLLTHPSEAERPHEAGYRPGRRNHTWARRFDQLVRAIGMNR